MILRQHRPHLLLKIPLAVVRLLLVDVLDQRRHVRWTHRKRPISTLPRKPFNTMRLHPSGRMALQLLHQLRQTLRRVQPHREMNMIGYATHPQTITSPVTNHGREVSMKRSTHSLVQKRPSILRAEHHVNQHETQSLGHARNYKSGLRPSSASTKSFLGLRPRLVLVALTALFASLLVSTNCTAQSTTIRIHVLDGRTGRPLAHRQIEVDEWAPNHKYISPDRIQRMVTDSAGYAKATVGEDSMVSVSVQHYWPCEASLPASERSRTTGAMIRQNGYAPADTCGDHQRASEAGVLVSLVRPYSFGERIFSAVTR
jgi:hypothetical protein